MTEADKTAFQSMVACRNTEVTLRWQRVQMFIVLHTGALAFAANESSDVWRSGLLAITGLILSFAWLAVNQKSQHWVNYWHDRLEELETKERTKSDSSMPTMFSGSEWGHILHDGPTFHFLVMSLASLALLGWIFLIARFVHLHVQ